MTLNCDRQWWAQRESLEIESHTLSYNEVFKSKAFLILRGTPFHCVGKRSFIHERDMVNAIIQKEIAKWTFTAVIVADKKASVDMELCHIHMLIYS